MRTLVCVWLSSVAFSLSALAEETPVSAETIDFSNYEPSVSPARIPSAEAPKIDGDLSDPVWQKATVVSEFFQVEPEIGPPSEKTIVYLAYDERALYVGVNAYDSEPEKILATILEQDGDVWRDDMIRFYIDPFNTDFSGFGFDVNGLGARADRIIQRGRRPIDEWDTIWDSAGSIDEEGWKAEFVIPFRSIGFNPSEEGWNLLITRELSRKNEEIRWASIDRSINSFDFRRPGKMKDVNDIEQGIGLDVEVLGKISATRDWPRPRNDSLEFEPSGNIYYKLTPSLTGLLTVNSDFSDTPLDTRQINTGRFSLFFPETRDFFLQDASLFEFGGQTFSDSPNGRPFFSRRIGIVQGQPVDLQVGAKLSGEYKGVEIGALSARMGSANGVQSQTLSVARATVDVLGSSRLGVIATNGDPTGSTDNTLVGADFLFREPHFFGAGLLQADLFYQRTITSENDGSSFGARVAYPNDRWNWKASFRQLGEDFRPALGFVNRPGTRTFNNELLRRFRPASGYFRWWEFGPSSELITDLDGNLESRENGLILRAQNNASDEYLIEVLEAEEVVTRSFSLPRGINVPVGRYDNSGVRAQFQSSFFRPYGLIADINYRDYFGGTNLRTDISATARPSPYWNITTRYIREDISVPAGDVTIQIGSIDGVVNLTPDLSISTQAQYDNISEAFSVFSRLRWELRPETEVFVSFGHGAFIRTENFPRDFESIQSQMVLRFGNRFQF